jgi:hypothetical protein
MSKKEDDIGKWFEGKLQGIFDTLRGRKRCTYLRLYDSRSAGHLIPKQPADFIVTAKALGAILLEAKASIKHDSLRSCLSANVELHQAASHRLWAAQGQPAWFIFYSNQTHEVEIWDGQYVGHCRGTGKRLDASQCLHRMPYDDLEPWLLTITAPPPKEPDYDDSFDRKTSGSTA